MEVAKPRSAARRAAEAEAEPGQASAGAARPDQAGRSDQIHRQLNSALARSAMRSGRSSGIQWLQPSATSRVKSAPGTRSPQSPPQECRSHERRTAAASEPGAAAPRMRVAAGLPAPGSGRTGTAASWPQRGARSRNWSAYTAASASGNNVPWPPSRRNQGIKPGYPTTWAPRIGVATSAAYQARRSPTATRGFSRAHGPGELHSSSRSTRSG
jgi:hypothetical protein